MLHNGYSYDSINNTLTMSAAFAKKAGQINTPEYRIVRQLHADNPGLKVEKHSGGRGRTGIKYSSMMNYISKCREHEKYRAAFETIKELSKGQPNPYRYVVTWFTSTFPEYSEQPIIDEDGFVMVKAVQEQDTSLKLVG